MSTSPVATKRGSALLAVLWLSAALSAIAFSVANTVRGETERTATASDGVRTYYLATGGVERALLHIQWGGTYYTPPVAQMRFTFPSGDALVEMIPENSKFNLNSVTPEELNRLLLNLGADPGRARQIVLGIMDWRAAAPGGPTEFDQYYLSLTPSFRSPHASFQEIEEVLLVRGMTPDLFYGTYEREYAPDQTGSRLRARGGLKDCVSVFGNNGRFDVNGAEPAVLMALGIDPQAVGAIVAARQQTAFRAQDQLAPFGQSGPGFARLGIGGSTMFTLRSTGRLRLPNGQLSDLRKTVSATVKLLGGEWNPPYHVMRWYDNASSQTSGI